MATHRWRSITNLHSPNTPPERRPITFLWKVMWMHRVDRGVATQWRAARHRKISRDSGKFPRPRHRARHARDLQPLRPPGCAQGVGYTARRDRALSTHRLAVAGLTEGILSKTNCIAI